MILKMHDTCVLPLILFVLNSICFTWSFTAYDCESTSVNVTAINRNIVGDCVSSYRPPNVEQVEIQLIQIATKMPVVVKSCRVVISRQITHCGMRSYSSVVAGGFANYVMDLTKTQCEELHLTRRLMVQGVVDMRDITLGTKVTRSVVLAGTVDSEGNCDGSSYSDAFGSWNNVLVQASVEIATRDYKAIATIEDDMINLEEGVRCKMETGHCVDYEIGLAFWKIRSKTSCDPDYHIVLYEGPAQKITQTNGMYNTTSYLVEQHDKAFALDRRTPYAECYGIYYQTEHARLLISESSGRPFQLRRGLVPAAALDMALYTNSKIVYVSRQLTSQIQDLHRLIEIRKCENDKKALEVHLALASSVPDEFGLLTKGGPGYTSKILGEVIYLIACQSVEVTIRQTSVCYEELPITYNEKEAFMRPRSRIIQSVGTPLTCNALLRPLYRINHRWFSSNLGLQRAEDPDTIQPNQPNDYIYKTTESLAMRGIYSDDEVQKMTRQIAFPLQRDAVQAVLVRGLLGEKNSNPHVKFSNLMTDDVISHVTDSIYIKLWSGFSIVGNVTSALLGVFVVLRTMKWLIDMIINGKILYDIFGFGFRMLACVLDSLTTYMVHKRTSESATGYVAKGRPTGGKDESIPLNNEPEKPSAPSSHTPAPRTYPQLNELLRNM